jgi:hypothetical protein
MPGNGQVRDLAGQPTLPGKHRSTVGEMARKYGAITATPAGPRKILQVTIERDGAGSHWSPASAAYPCGECARPSSPTSGPSWPAPSETS